MKPIDQMTLPEALAQMRNTVLLKSEMELCDRIHELTRWIPVSERMPTEKDADTRGKVMWYFWGEHYESRYWNLHSDYGATHWKRITPPEATP
jgi:hypothetical protein